MLPTLLCAASLFHLFNAQTISIETCTTSDDYLCTESAGFGTPKQSLRLLVHTTDTTSWAYNASVNTDNSKFNPSASSTYQASSDQIHFTYQNMSVTVQKATDTVWIGDASATHSGIGIGLTKFNITENEGVAGFLCLDRQSGIVPALRSNGSIENASISLDLANERVYFGPHTPSDINNQSNATSCSDTTNANLQVDWTFDVTIAINGAQTNADKKIRAVIDSASPYITVYARSQDIFEGFWHAVDFSANQNFNCNYSTRLCSDSGAIMSWMTVYVEDVNWNITIFQDNVLDGDYILFLYDPDRAYTVEGDTDIVLFLGRPFLDKLVVTMDYTQQTLTFFTVYETSDSLDWTVIGIVFGCVVAFAGLFFGFYYWKYGKIAPPSNHDVEEQSHSLLRGPVQAVGHGPASGMAQQPTINQGSGAAFSSGVSGLDEDDDEYQHQLQQAARQSAIEAQQRRERQLREERERRQREEDEQKQMDRQRQHEQQSQAQVGGGRLGGAAVKPEDKASLRDLRLKALERQMSQEQKDQQDNK